MKKKILNNNFTIIFIVALASAALVLFSNVVLASVVKLLRSLNNKSLSQNFFSADDLFNFHLEYKAYYLITLLVIILTDIKIVLSMRMNFKDINKVRREQANLQL